MNVLIQYNKKIIEQLSSSFLGSVHWHYWPSKGSVLKKPAAPLRRPHLCLRLNTRPGKEAGWREEGPMLQCSAWPLLSSMGEICGWVDPLEGSWVETRKLGLDPWCWSVLGGLPWKPFSLSADLWGLSSISTSNSLKNDPHSTSQLDQIFKCKRSLIGGWRGISLIPVDEESLLIHLSNYKHSGSRWEIYDCWYYQSIFLTYNTNFKMDFWYCSFLTIGKLSDLVVVFFLTQ